MQPASKAAATLSQLTNPKPTIPRGELAKELGVSEQSIGSWCRGEGRPSADNIKKLDEILRRRGCTEIPPGDWFVDVPASDGSDL